MKSLATSMSSVDTVENGVPRIRVGEWIESGFDWLQENLGVFFDALSDGIETTVGALSGALLTPPAMVTVAILALLAWLAGTWKLGAMSLIGLTFIISMDQWSNAMDTLSLVVIAALIALLIGIPLGVLAARSDRVSRVIRPVMDLMQTMPAFVWLVPVVTLLTIGVPSAMVATVIFALPPGVRLTELGIRQVDAEVVEAGHAFGATPRQVLRGIQMPLATPTVMAGINQVIMLALSMAVIAGLVGGGGLGGAVVSSISRLNVGLGFEAGLSVVALAIYLDRITAALGASEERRAKRIVRRRTKAARQHSDTTDAGIASAPSTPAPQPVP